MCYHKLKYGVPLAPSFYSLVLILGIFGLCVCVLLLFSLTVVLHSLQL